MVQIQGLATGKEMKRTVFFPVHLKCRLNLLIIPNCGQDALCELCKSGVNKHKLDNLIAKCVQGVVVQTVHFSYSLEQDSP